MEASDIINKASLKRELQTAMFDKKQIRGLKQALEAGGFAQAPSDWDSVIDPTRILNKPTIPTTLAGLTDDATHRLVTDTDKSTWDGKQDEIVLPGDASKYYDGTGNFTVPAGGGGGGGPLSGTWASRPAANTVPAGTWYIPTDGYPPSRCVLNGGVYSWVVSVKGLDCSPVPAAASFTAINFAYGGGTTLVADGDGLLFTQNGSGTTTDNYALALTSLPAAPYTFTVGYDLQYVYPAGFSTVAIIVADGNVNPKFLALLLSQTSSGALTSNCYVQYWNNVTSYVGAYTLTQRSALNVPYGVLFFQIEDDGVTRFYRYSLDGRIFKTLYSHANTTFITPTYAGLGLDQSYVSVSTGLIRVQTKVFDWSLG